MLTKLSKENFSKEVLESNEKVLVDFYADWCTPCQMLMPQVEAFAEENPGQKVFKVNIDDDMEIAQQYGVMTIPTLIVLKTVNLLEKKLTLKLKRKLRHWLTNNKIAYLNNSI